MCGDGAIVRGDAPVGHVDDPMGVRLHAAVVRDDDHGASACDGELLHQRHHGVAAGQIERRGRFVRKDDARRAGKGAGDGHPLLLAPLSSAG